ncbi:MAG TPA: surface-adhesin E family protein [Burkholderiales bacterium]|nr:surface-adhesin E family protein [Burkholderiales bacterium]
MKARAACVAAAIGLAAPAPAPADWTVVASAHDYFLEFDPDWVRVQGPYAMAWTRMTFTVPQHVLETGAKYQSQLQLHAVDCATSASTVVGAVLYSGALGRGEAVHRTPRPRAEWQPKPVQAGSLGGLTVQLTCAELARRTAQPAADVGKPGDKIPPPRTAPRKK